MPNRPKREAWEDVVGGNYAARMRKKGPREGESNLSFEIRMGGLEAGRRALVDALRRTGDVNNAFGRLGIPQKNVGLWIKRLGYTREELETVKGDLVHRGLPTGS